MVVAAVLMLSFAAPVAAGPVRFAGQGNVEAQRDLGFMYGADPMAMINVDFVVAVIAQLAVVFAGMRLFYGCWPWEAEKTWRRLRPKTPAPEPDAAEVDELLALDPIKALAPVDDARTETQKDTFVREELANTVMAAMRSRQVTVQPLFEVRESVSADTVGKFAEPAPEIETKTKKPKAKPKQPHYEFQRRVD